jgi:hypothetical protein
MLHINITYCNIKFQISNVCQIGVTLTTTLNVAIRESPACESCTDPNETKDTQITSSMNVNNYMLQVN